MQSVLVIDDDPSLRRTVAAWIDSFGYAVDEAARVEDALEAMQESPRDIALCDVSLVARDGVWLAWRLREQYPQTAIIMATALRDAETAASSLRNDVVDYLLKPFDRARLFEALLAGATDTPPAAATKRSITRCRIGCASGARSSPLPSPKR
ncbi:MAG: response regulator [Acidobacteria bacterium]|nr:response regulator [Acidobacteriota bacterium]